MRFSDYQGPREAKSIVDHLLGMMPSNVRFVKSEVKTGASKKVVAFDDFLNSEVLWALRINNAALTIC